MDFLYKNIFKPNLCIKKTTSVYYDWTYIKWQFIFQYICCYHMPHFRLLMLLKINILLDWYFHPLSSSRYHTDIQHSLLNSISSVSLWYVVSHKAFLNLGYLFLCSHLGSNQGPPDYAINIFYLISNIFTWTMPSPYYIT